MTDQVEDAPLPGPPGLVLLYRYGGHGLDEEP
jgi:hypothetical protein